MFYVKAHGKTVAELRKALLTAYNELGGEVTHTAGLAVVTGSTDGYNIGSDVDTGDEMEEVKSPYAGATPSAHLAAEKDADGLPWDARIHSSNKKLTSKGVWTTRRGVDDAVYYQVRAELLAANTVSPTVVGSTQLPPSNVTSPVQQPVQPQQPVQAPTPAPVMPTVQGGHTLATFSANFPMVISTLITEGKIKQDYVKSLTDWCGVPEIWMANEEQKAAIFEQFVSYGFVSKVG